MLLPVVQQFQRHGPGEEPIVVSHPSSHQELKVFVVHAYNMNDIRGLPHATCGGHPPRKVGSCNLCHIAGQYHRKTTVIPGAVRQLPKDHSLVAEYREEFSGCTKLANLADQGKPAKRTKQEAIDAGNRVLTGVSRENEEPYTDVDLYTTHLWYHDKIMHTLYDAAHEEANTVQQSLIWITNHAGNIHSLALACVHLL
jgi:hypothetical protein